MRSIIFGAAWFRHSVVAVLTSDIWKIRQLASDSFLELTLATECFAEKNPLLHICDLYDTALCLRVFWILHHSYVQFFLAFAEGDVGCAITGGDLKYV